jgi:hypothetical protein
MSSPRPFSLPLLAILPFSSPLTRKSQPKNKKTMRFARSAIAALYENAAYRFEWIDLMPVGPGRKLSRTGIAFFMLGLRKNPEIYGAAAHKPKDSHRKGPHAGQGRHDGHIHDRISGRRLKAPAAWRPARPIRPLP